MEGAVVIAWLSAVFVVLHFLGRLAEGLGHIIPVAITIMELVLLISDDTYGQEEFEDCTPCDACFRLIELRAYTSFASIVVELRALRVLKTDLEIEVG